jgi:hypothetical protein
MLDWAAKHLKRWPSKTDYDYLLEGADPSSINARFYMHDGYSSLPVLECCMGGGSVDSLDYFYRMKRK